MVLITVCNLTKDDYSPEKIEHIEAALSWAATGIPELKLEKTDISFFFPSDPSAPSDAPVAIFVDLLNVDLLKNEDPVKNPKAEIFELLAKLIAAAFKKTAKDYWGKESKVEVLVRPFNPEIEGYASG